MNVPKTKKKQQKEKLNQQMLSNVQKEADNELKPK
jgi:hypothetical protein